MTIVSQNAGKQGFFVTSGRNSGKNYEVLTTYYAKQTQFKKSQNERKHLLRRGI